MSFIYSSGDPSRPFMQSPGKQRNCSFSPTSGFNPGDALVPNGGATSGSFPAILSHMPYLDATHNPISGPNGDEGNSDNNAFNALTPIGSGPVGEWIEPQAIRDYFTSIEPDGFWDPALNAYMGVGEWVLPGPWKCEWTCGGFDPFGTGITTPGIVIDFYYVLANAANTLGTHIATVTVAPGTGSAGASGSFTFSLAGDPDSGPYYAINGVISGLPATCPDTNPYMNFSGYLHQTDFIP